MNETELSVLQAEDNHKSLLDKLRDVYETLPPEKQVVFGVFASYVYLSVLTAPKSLPVEVQPFIELLDKMPSSSISIWIATLIAMLGSIDGVRRMITERLPFYKAYVQVFLLHNLEDEEESV